MTTIKISFTYSEALKSIDECEIYLVNISESEPSCIYVYEVWSNENAHQASLTNEATQTLIRNAKPLITGIERISTLKTQGGKRIS